MDQRNTALLITGFVVILIGAVLIGTVASEEQDLTTKDRINNESHTFYCVNSSAVNASGVLGVNVTYSVTEAPLNTWKQADCPLTNFVLQAVNGTTLTLNTDYNVDLSIGNYSLISDAPLTMDEMCDAGEANTTHASYTHCPDNYLNSSFGRTMLDIVPGFFAIAILGIGIGLVYKVMRNEGILGI